MGSWLGRWAYFGSAERPSPPPSLRSSENMNARELSTWTSAPDSPKAFPSFSARSGNAPQVCSRRLPRATSTTDPVGSIGRIAKNTLPWLRIMTDPHLFTWMKSDVSFSVLPRAALCQGTMSPHHVPALAPPGEPAVGGSLAEWRQIVGTITRVL